MLTEEDKEDKPAPFLRTEFLDQIKTPSFPRMAVGSQPFPATGAKGQISKSGGMVPKWRRDGKELFYVAAGRQFTAVDVTLPKGTLQAGIPKPRFASRAGGVRPNSPSAATAGGFRCSSGRKRIRDRRRRRWC